MMATRARSASPGLRRSPSPLGVSVAKRRAQLAERVAESAISGVGQVADEVQKARIEAAAAAAKAESAKGTIRLQAASLSAHVEASAAKDSGNYGGTRTATRDTSQVYTRRTSLRK